jgi:hypothetical protein
MPKFNIIQQNKLIIRVQVSISTQTYSERVFVKYNWCGTTSEGDWTNYITKVIQYLACFFN